MRRKVEDAKNIIMSEDHKSETYKSRLVSLSLRVQGKITKAKPIKVDLSLFMFKDFPPGASPPPLL